MKKSQLKKTPKITRKWSKDYCKKTSCKKMGFSQKASCRVYKNCYKKSSKSKNITKNVKKISKNITKNVTKRSKINKSNQNKIKQCKQQKISQVMSEFKNKTLKLRNNKPVTNPKQAIAIALSIASKKCSN